MRIDIVTVMPAWFGPPGADPTEVGRAAEAVGPLATSLLGRARDAGLVDVRVHDLRRWATDRHRTVDDVPYGGGAGMVLMAEPFFAAVEELYGRVAARPRTVVLTPRGRTLDQDLVRELAAEDRLLLLCGRYEGIDERVHTGLAHDEISIGDYVLAGGEVAAAVVVEAVTRLLPGVMGNAGSAEEESFASGLLEYPQYTRPPEHRGVPVPEVLRSGHHGLVRRWRHEQSLERTRSVRPDLYARWRARRKGDGGVGPDVGPGAGRDAGPDAGQPAR